MASEVRLRTATLDDIPVLSRLISESARQLSRGFYTEAEAESAIRYVFGVDTALVNDQTYYVASLEGQLAGCGGWSRRATLYGGNRTPGRDANLLDPAVDPARVRAMYTHPAHARRGVGRLILSLCEAAAAAEGFTRLSLMSTLSGEPLYTAYGFQALERLEDATGGAPVPIVRMEKSIVAETALGASGPRMAG